MLAGVPEKKSPTPSGVGSHTIGAPVAAERAIQNEQRVSISDGTVLVQTQSWTGSTWFPTDKSITKYVGGNPVRIGASWYVVDRTYDNQNRIVASQQYNGGYPTWRTVYLYSPVGRMRNIISLYWEATKANTWDTLIQTIRFYDSNGYLTGDSSYSPNLNGISRHIITNDANGFVLQNLYQGYAESGWQDFERNTYTRDAAGNQLTNLAESWNGSILSPTSFDSSTYSNNKLTRNINKKYTSGIWVNSVETMYSYDLNGDNLQTTLSLWNNGSWSLYSQDSYSTLPGKNIVLLFPNAPQTFYPSDSLVISWISSGVSNVNIQLSSDNGSTWQSLAANRVDSSLGYHTFRNASISSAQCIVRVSDASDQSVNDQSASPFEFSLEVQMLTHETGTVQVSVFKTGDIGYTNGTSYGAGFEYKGSNDPLYAAGVITGTSSTGVYGLMRSFNIDDLTVAVPLGLFSSNSSFSEISDITFSLPAAPAPLNQLTIRQLVYSKLGADYVFCVYTVTNTSGSVPISGLQVGMMADWDVGVASTNLGGIVAGKNLVYQFNPGGTQDANYYGIISLNNFTGAKLTDSGTTAATRLSGWGWGWISGVASESIVRTVDYRSFIGSGPYSIPANGYVQAGFALAGASSLDELKAKADTVISAWQSGLLNVPRIENDRPMNYSLSQNYPNPFNPTTTIDFSLPKRTKVSIEIFDLLGRHVESIVDEEKAEGKYRVRFDASSLSSGMYFYRIQAGTFSQTRKLMLLR